MSWAKLDDALLDHQKILAAAARFGRDGAAKALGFYCAGLIYAQKHLTNGFLSTTVLKRMRYVDRPLQAARTMVAVNLWERTRGGFKIHDYHDVNPTAAEVKERIAYLKKIRSRAGSSGANARWHRGKTNGTPNGRSGRNGR